MSVPAVANLLPVLLVTLPAAGAMAMLAVRSHALARAVGLATMVLTAIAALLMLLAYDASAPARYGTGGVVQLVTVGRWIPAIGAEFRVGVDGLALPLVGLTAVIMPLAGLAAWNERRWPRSYWALLLLLESGLMGTFLSLDLLLLFVFFELTLVPMYLLVGVWGGPRRQQAAIKFFLYTLAGSLGLLVTVVGVYLRSRGVAPEGCLDLVRLASPEFRGVLGGAVGAGLFAASLLAFLVKLPAVPLHTWLPDAHVEAPTPVSMVLAGVVLKMGAFGLLRVSLPLFPEAARGHGTLMCVIGAVSIVWGALAALGQRDFKRLVAYSSVGHMGFVLLGIGLAAMGGVSAETALSGAVFLMFAHGITSPACFMAAGAVYDRLGHREMARAGGLASAAPSLFFLSAGVFLAAMGLPGLCNFVGELLVIVAAFDSPAKGYAVAALVGVIVSAGYTLWALQRVFLGPPRPATADAPDVSAREALVLGSLLVGAAAFGVIPGLLFFPVVRTSVRALLGVLGGA